MLDRNALANSRASNLEAIRKSSILDSVELLRGTFGDRRLAFSGKRVDIHYHNQYKDFFFTRKEFSRA